MHINAGYYYGMDVDDAGIAYSFFVSGCGHYQLVKRQEFQTLRPEGRQDWQLLYIAGGQAYFDLPKGRVTAREGDAFLYRPGQPQHYGYLLVEKPDIYWLHFSGAQTEQLLEKTKLPSGEVFHPGFQSECPRLFGLIIRELQLGSLYGQELAATYTQALLYLLSRGFIQQSGPENLISPELRQTVEWMHRHPESSRSMADFARQCSMSISTFIRRFRAHTGLPPQRYIIRLRMAHARELMASSQLSISDIARLVGYDNPLYFSRLFKKEMGMPPRAYRQSL